MPLFLFYTTPQHPSELSMAVGAPGFHHGNAANDANGEEDNGTTYSTTSQLFIQSANLCAMVVLDGSNISRNSIESSKKALWVAQRIIIIIIIQAYMACWTAAR